MKEKSSVVKIEEPKKQKKKVNSKFKESVILIAGGIFLFFIVVYFVMSEDNPGIQVKNKTDNKDIMAQIDEMEKNKKSREEKEKKIQDDVFMGNEMKVKGFVNDLMNNLKDHSEETGEDLFDVNSLSSGISEEKPIGIDDVDISGEIISDNSDMDLEETDISKEEIKSDDSIVPMHQRQRQGSIIAFSNRYKNARIYNDGNEIIINQNNDSGKKFRIKEKNLLETNGGEFKKNNTIKLVYNNNPVKRIYEGEYIDAVILNRIVNDKHISPITAVITKDIFDNSGEYVLLPANTKIIGKALPISSQQQNRQVIYFHRFILPNGKSIYFEKENQKLSALGMRGVYGIKGRVNTHFFKKYGAAILYGLLNGVGGYAQNRLSQTSGTSIVIDKSADNFSEVNEEIRRDAQEVTPTITIKEGTRTKIFIAADIELSAYQKIKNRSYFRSN